MRAVQKVMDALTAGGTKADNFRTDFGTFRIDPNHAPQRILAYSFLNVLAHYSNSPLGHLIRSRAWSGDTFVDIGANLGMYSLLARAAGADVYMVEPEPAHFAFLQRNGEILGKTLPIALSDERGQLPLYYSANNSGATSLVQSDGYFPSRDTVVISTFSEQNFGDPTRISLVKIDVEGNVARTVRGMRDFLDAGHRPDIWCEVRGGTASRSRNSCFDVIESLQQFGYEFREVSPTGGKDFDRRSVFDLLFVPRRRN